MRYLIILFTFLFTNLYSADVNKYNNINSFLISSEGGRYKQTTYEEYKTNKLKNFKIKMGIDKKTLKNKPYYLTIIDKDDSLKYTNAKYEIYDHMKVIKLDESIEKNLYFEYSYNTAQRIAFRFNVISDFEYKYILPFEGILYGLAYGIIFSAFLYYLIIYSSTRRIYFLYYSIMQLFVLLSLIGFVYFSFKPYPNELGQTIVDIFETSGFIFTILFAKEVLNTKRVMPYMNYILNFFLFINILDIFAIFIFKQSIFYEYMPFYLSFLLPFIAGIISIIKGNKISVFYTLGWFMVFLVVYLYEKDMIPLSGIYTIHLTLPLESLIFSFALTITLRELVQKQNEKEKLLIHKSKLASMGEMIDNIAHQWRQPLMHLGYINMNLEMSSQSDKFEKEYFIKKIKESNNQIKFMSKTIDDFSDFYKIEKEKQEFLISNACKLAINIINPTLKKKNINLNLTIKKDSFIKGYENEYAQVILNFFTNSIEIFETRKIENPIINILIETINNKSITKVFDNGKGIKNNSLEEIFDAYVSTKKKGSGIGLYMSRVIIQSHFDGNIYASNNKEGACFTIEV